MTNARDRINDPDGHYPYKITAVLDLIEQNPPAGPSGPDDARAEVRDFTSVAIAEASAAYVNAQARYVENPADPEFKSIYQTARDTLIAARQRHRANRTSMTVVAVKGAE